MPTTKLKKIIKNTLNEMENHEEGFKIGNHTYGVLELGDKKIHLGEDGILINMNTNLSWDELLKVFSIAKKKGFV